MLESMTGFAEVSGSAASFTIRVSLKSVNGKNLRIHTSLNHSSALIEEKAYTVLRSTFDRGSISATITLHTNPFNEKLFEDFAGIMKKIPASLKPVSAEIGSLVRTVRAASELRDIPDTVIKKAGTLTAQAVKGLRLSRRTEGRKLSEEMLPLAETIKKFFNTLSTSAPGIEKKFRKEMLTSLNKLLKESGAEAVESDISREIAARCEKADFREEVARAQIHIDNFIGTIRNKKTAVGKKLDFLCQELAREANTLSVKFKDKIWSSKIIDLKTWIEKLREQVQNVQ